MSDKIRVLIVDDTVTYRLILKNALSKIPEVEVVGQAQDGNIAVKKVIELNPDLVLLDIEMPEMDGFETLKAIRAQNTESEVVIVSSQNQENIQKTLATLNQGALDFIAKPTTQSRDASEAALVSYLKPIINVVQIRKNTKSIRKDGRVPPSLKPQEVTPLRKIIKPVGSTPRVSHAPPKKVDYVLIGISTGGPQALQTMIPKLSDKLTCPVLLVQHMPPVFTKELADRLNGFTKLSVREGKAGEVPKAGDVLIAPGGTHMTLEKHGDIYRIAMVDSPPVNSCKPAVDVLFDSVARYFSDTILTVIMTGMGADGAKSVKNLRTKGAYSLIQEESSCTIWGMPAAVKENGDADEEIPLNEIANRISQIVLKNNFYS